MRAENSGPAAVNTAGQDMQTIGQLAKSFGVTLRALRFYEDRGLIRPYREGPSRFYDGAARARLQLILRGKQLGFTLSEIREMISTGGDGTLPAAELSLGAEKVLAQIDLLQRQRAGIERAIMDLKAAHEKMAAGHAGAISAPAERMQMAAAG